VALGAVRRDVQRLVIRQGLVLAAMGTGIGVLAALAATRVLGSLLYQVTPSDRGTYLSIVALIGAAALLASWIPARRATRIHPMEALRTE
jgi:putative ABC transport system permease protein